MDKKDLLLVGLYDGDECRANKKVESTCNKKSSAMPVSEPSADVLVEALISARDLLASVETCSRNNFEQLAYEEVGSINKAIASYQAKLLPKEE